MQSRKSSKHKWKNQRPEDDIKIPDLGKLYFSKCSISAHLLISQLFSGDLQKYIVQCRKLRKDSSKRNILALQIIEKPDQVMLGIGTAHDQHLFFILYIKHMIQCANILEIFSSRAMASTVMVSPVLIICFSSSFVPCAITLP